MKVLQIIILSKTSETNKLSKNPFVCAVHRYCRQTLKENPRVLNIIAKMETN